MSRTVIAAVVAAVIVALTVVAFFVTSTSIDDKVRKDADSRLARAFQVADQLNQLRAIDIQNKAENLAGDPSFVQALRQSNEMYARDGFTKFTSGLKAEDPKPDMIALVDHAGLVIAMHDVPSVTPKQWLKDPGKPGDTVIPALNVVLGNKVIISDIWRNQDQMMKIGVAPVINPDAQVQANDEGTAIIGAIVVAYSQTSQGAQIDKSLLGTEIAYYDAQTVAATSFTKGATSEEDSDKGKRLNEIIKAGKVAPGSKTQQRVNIDGVDYFAAAFRMPYKTTNNNRMPKGYPQPTAGALVLSPISDSQNTSATIKLFILLLGLGALAISVLGLYLSHRRLIAQVDAVELGVTDIINGNVDRTFRPVGPELDGLANGLNVMLARLLGRPEPGEEEFDEEGNPIIPGRVEFEESEEGAKPQTDPDLAALAQESEPDYYKRVFTEYVAQRKAVGSPDDVSFENFIAKLKVNEGKLKAQYQCRTVRFRVITKDGKVTLKPVPIFA
jgi:hypothetical protein